MTYNVYLGANLQPLFGENDLGRLIQKAAAILAHFDTVDFRIRAVAIAHQIIEQDPDVVALQEVSLLETSPPSSPPQFTTRYDFLQILLDELERQGHPFHAVSINPNFTGTLPVDFVGSLARLTDRNVIIVPGGDPASELITSNPAQDVYDRTLDVPLGGMTFHAQRGWASIDVVFHGQPFRFFDTHFEAFDPDVRKDQVAELAQIMSSSPYPVVLAGDINLFPRDVRPLDDAAWKLLGGAGFRDAWVVAECFEPRYTAGQTDDLDNVPSILDNTVDYVLFDKDFETKPVERSCDIAGEELDDRTNTVPALWPSDHAAVAVDLRIAKP
ncbi:MAG TPA: endonuclease/exonuclease/phosphatase family protein [Actinomycetota bacterium]|nr:endonuclease/exonuclease/phosphatase family protein [Actinomycetota bacterium]